MKKIVFWLVLIAIAGAGAWYFSARQDAHREDHASMVPLQKVEPEPQIKHPVAAAEPAAPAEQEEATPPPEPLPALDDSDPAMTDALDALFGQGQVKQDFVLEHFINRVVATVDSLTSARVAPLVLPLKPVAGKFTVTESDGGKEISAANQARYTPYVNLAVSADTGRVVAVYEKYYPLFQQAYQDLGYPKGYFNDRLIEVLDVLLATPEPDSPPKLVANEAVYQFADPALEALPVGQKMMLKLSRSDRDRVKAKIREIRQALTASDE